MSLPAAADIRRKLALQELQEDLRRCRACPAMAGPPVTGQPVLSPVVLVGQAPGVKEVEVHRPFAWTAGKTLFKWFAEIGLEENGFRRQVYMAAVCRCFPGKQPRGGDRVPDRHEIANCRRWLEKELALLQPELVVPVGKLAIQQFFPVSRLEEIVGRCLAAKVGGRDTDIIPLPHPSGASVWHRLPPGKALLGEALGRIAAHPAWLRLCREAGA